MNYYLRDNTEFYVAIDNKGPWPNLRILPNGELGVLIYNHPSHGLGSGSGIELYVSSDGGRSFQFRSLVSSLENDSPDAIRMHNTFGVNSKGHLLAITCGFQAHQKKPLLPLQLCVSEDNGLSWRHKVLEKPVTETDSAVPYGNIINLDNGELVCCLYGTNFEKEYGASMLCSSFDDGETWSQKAVIDRNINETFLLNLKKDNMLYASARTRGNKKLSMDRVLPHGLGEKLYESSDGGKSWGEGRLVSPQGQENASLLELADGRLLYCFTSRIPGLFGIVYRVSEDQGKSWSPHEVLISIGANNWEKTDVGYPSSVQLEDGTIVTAYYFGPKKPEYASQTTPWHQRYHMGIARWRV